MRSVTMLLAAATALLLAGGMPANSASSGSSSSGSHYYGSHSGSSHSSTGSGKTALPPGTKFIKKTCKTDSCKAKHPTGEYMVPIKPKKNAS